MCRNGKFTLSIIYPSLATESMTLYDSVRLSPCKCACGLCFMYVSIDQLFKAVLYMYIHVVLACVSCMWSKLMCFAI